MGVPFAVVGSAVGCVVVLLATGLLTMTGGASSSLAAYRSSCHNLMPGIRKYMVIKLEAE